MVFSCREHNPTLSSLSLTWHKHWEIRGETIRRFCISQHCCTMSRSCLSLFLSPGIRWKQTRGFYSRYWSMCIHFYSWETGRGKHSVHKSSDKILSKFQVCFETTKWPHKVLTAHTVLSMSNQVYGQWVFLQLKSERKILHQPCLTEYKCVLNRPNSKKQ